MKAIKLFTVNAIVRQDPDKPSYDGNNAELQIEMNVRARNELQARRTVLEEAWDRDSLVSHFLTIIQQTP